MISCEDREGIRFPMGRILNNISTMILCDLDLQFILSWCSDTGAVTASYSF